MTERTLAERVDSLEQNVASHEEALGRLGAYDEPRKPLTGDDIRAIFMAHGWWLRMDDRNQPTYPFDVLAAELEARR